MSGRILIVDDLATNRIVLKVKLANAYYKVLQAGSGREALETARMEKPDMILASASLSDLGATGFVTALRDTQETARIPVVLILQEASDAARIDALQAGANDVMVKPVEETLLLARLRSLLRQSHSDHDLRLHESTARALGFSEAVARFRHPGRIALVAPQRADALHLCAELRHRGGHEFIPLPMDQAVTYAGDSPAPDIYLLKIGADQCDAGLRLMAELRAAPATRNCPVIIALEEDAFHMAAIALDMGASDIICSTAPPQEFVLRISAQLRIKQTAEMMRNQLHDGLNAAVIDPLTGLYNRRFALPYLERLIASSWQGGRSFAVMVADIDHFKRVNDRFGHAAGDAVLARVAHELRSNLGANDMIARIGGEEFLIVTPETTRSEARQAAGRLCQLVQTTPIDVASTSERLQITISIGVTMGIPCTGAPPLVEALLGQADRALYGSKADGRNTVTLAARSAA